MSSPASTSETTTDGRQEGRMQKYTDYWDSELDKDDQQHIENRRSNYADVVNGYYDAATLLYEYAWSASFHFSRFYKGEGFTASLARHEHYLAASMNLRPGMRVLDVGCGVGEPARQIARFADVNITGLNNNHYQLQRAAKHTQRAGLEKQVTFVEGDFMKLTQYFGENTFDAGMLSHTKLCSINTRVLIYPNSVRNRGHCARPLLGRSLRGNFESSQTRRYCEFIRTLCFGVTSKHIFTVWCIRMVHD